MRSGGVRLHENHASLKSLVYQANGDKRNGRQRHDTHKHRKPPGSLFGYSRIAFDVAVMKATSTTLAFVKPQRLDIAVKLLEVDCCSSRRNPLHHILVRSAFVTHPPATYIPSAKKPKTNSR